MNTIVIIVSILFTISILYPYFQDLHQLLNKPYYTMKRLIPILFLALFAVSMQAQDSFSDDFESYAAGDYPSATNSQWTTWSGTEGGGEDMQVSTDFAASGNNSVVFEGEAGGGPQDVVLDFGGVRTSGLFTFTSKFYCPSGKGAYFNFQGAATIGSAWAMNCFMNPDGSFTVDDGNTFWVSSTYPQDEWFEVSIEANLTHNFWRVYLNGDCIGSFTNEGTNAVASLDLFPIDGNFDFYVDDVSYEYNPTAPTPDPINDDALLILENNGTVGFAGSNRQITGFIANDGVNTITSVDIDYSIGGANYSQNLTLNLEPDQATPFTLDNMVTLENTPVDVVATVAGVNGVAGDDNACNDKGSLRFSGFTPHPDRKTFAEEATGAWCPWCPRGDVFMNLMDNRYPDHFVGVAVHNETQGPDGMALESWDTGVRNFNGFDGWPSVILERDVVIDPSAIENNIAVYLQEAPDATILHQATWDEATRELDVTVYTTFAVQAVGDYRLVVGITEDGVTGTGNGFAQANAYAGGDFGTMGGFESLPDPVPAEDMVYNHVARELLSPFGGVANAYSTSVIVQPGTYEHNFTYTVPADYNVDNMHIVSAVLQSGGVVDNAQSTTVNQTVDTEDIALENKVSISPNPAADVANIRIELDESVQLQIVVTDALGRVIQNRNYGQMNGDLVYPLITSDLTNGIYYIRVNANDSFAVKKLIVSK